MTDDYATDDESLCKFLDDELRETISKLAEKRGQKSGGVIKAGVKEIENRYEGRIIEFHNIEHARAYYSNQMAKHLEFTGALEELTPDGYYENPAECVKTELGRKKAEHKEKANAAARWLDDNDPDIHVVTNEYGGPEEVPQLDSELDVQHGESVAEEPEGGRTLTNHN
jgi:hypothetical protein